MKKTNEILIEEDVKIGDIILEAGDRIEVLDESNAQDLKALMGKMNGNDFAKAIGKIISKSNPDYKDGTTSALKAMIAAL